MDFKKPNKPMKRLLMYYAIAMVVLLLLNLLVVPTMMGTTQVEATYGTFLQDISEKKIDKVQINSNEILFTLKDNDKVIYCTGKMDDPNLVDRLYEAGITDFGAEITTETPWYVTFLVSWVLPMVLLFVAGHFLMKSLQKSMGGGGIGGNAMSFGKSNAKIYVQSENGIKFTDVAGEDEAKELLTEIVDFLHNPQRYAAIGAKIPKGALLVGPPGTGKTLLAKAVAGEANVPFFSISGSEFVEMFVGMGAAKVRDLFKQANEKAPCIVFIDEIDTIGKRRDGPNFTGGNDEREQTLNQLLAEMDGFDSSKGVIILAATNRPDSLDPALLRPGRFDRRIPVELPDLKGREEILKVHAKKVKMDMRVDYNAIARTAAGASGAELANIINEAALRAVRNGRQVVCQQDLEESVEVVIAGYQKKNAILTDDEKRIVAYHEVGHALVAALQTKSAPVTKITIIPRTSGALGYTMQVDEQQKNLMSKQELLNKVATLCGGRAAEELMFHDVTTGAANDIEQATKVARAMVTRYGMSDEFGMVAMETLSNRYLGGDTSMSCSDMTAKEIDELVVRIVKEEYNKAVEMLRAHMADLNRIAQYLYSNETITGGEFMDLLDDGEMNESYPHDTESEE